MMPANASRPMRADFPWAEEGTIEGDVVASQVSSSALDQPGIALSLEPLTVAEDPHVPAPAAQPAQRPARLRGIALVLRSRRQQAR